MVPTSKYINVDKIGGGRGVGVASGADHVLVPFIHPFGIFLVIKKKLGGMESKKEEFGREAGWEA